MAITFKVACAPKEIDDALWLRHQVYVVEEGRYGGQKLSDERIVDRFDVIPKVANIIAYDDKEPVAGIRLNSDTGIGLPPEIHFDFRQSIPCPLQNSLEKQIFASAGMLTVRQSWRRRRDVLPLLYRVAAGVLFSWDVTHVLASVSLQTTSIYRRMGFEPVADRIWIEEISDHIVPMVANAEDCYRWAFGEQLVPQEPIWQERRLHSGPNWEIIASKNGQGRRFARQAAEPGVSLLQD